MLGQDYNDTSSSPTYKLGVVLSDRSVGFSGSTGKLKKVLILKAMVPFIDSEFDSRNILKWQLSSSSCEQLWITTTSHTVCVEALLCEVDTYNLSPHLLSVFSYPKPKTGYTFNNTRKTLTRKINYSSLVVGIKNNISLIPNTLRNVT